MPESSAHRGGARSAARVRTISRRGGGRICPSRRFNESEPRRESRMRRKGGTLDARGGRCPNRSLAPRRAPDGECLTLAYEGDEPSGHHPARSPREGTTLHGPRSGSWRAGGGEKGKAWDLSSVGEDAGSPCPPRSHDAATAVRT